MMLDARNILLSLLLFFGGVILPLQQARGQDVSDSGSRSSILIRDEIPRYDLFFESIRLGNLIYSVSMG